MSLAHVAGAQIELTANGDPAWNIRKRKAAYWPLFLHTLIGPYIPV